MGFTGTFVLAAAVAEELEWVGGYDDHESLPGGWTALVVGDEDVFWDRERILARLVQETGRPALLALSLDSDFLGIVGRTPGGASWDGVIDAESAAAAREEGLEEGYDGVVPEFSGPDDAVAGALAWAAAAGWSADEAALRRLFTVTEWEQPADQYWPDLLAALGLGEAAADASPAPTAPARTPPARTAPARAARTKPLDQVVRDRIAPVLTEFGFTRKGRKFTLERADGARAFASVRSYSLARNDVEFHLDFVVQPRIWRDFAALQLGAGSEWGLWQPRLPGPTQAHWGFDLDDEEAGATLSRAVATAAPTVVAHLDPDKLLAHARSGVARHHFGTRPGVVLPLLMAAAEGPSPELDALLLELDADPDWADFNPVLTAFIRAWLAEHH